jgi:hypothetical protein
MSTLEERVQQADMAGKPDWEVSDILNAPDPAFPQVVTLKSRSFGVGSILELFGAVEGATFLDTLETLAAQNPVIKWSLVLLKDATLDAASPTLRAQLDDMAGLTLITAQQAAMIKGLAEEHRYPSWAEVNGIEVTPRTVGLARGGN